MKTYTLTILNESGSKQFCHLIRFSRAEEKAVILDSVPLNPGDQTILHVADPANIAVTTGGDWSPGDFIKQQYLPNSRLIVFHKDEITAVLTSKNLWKIN